MKLLFRQRLFSWLDSYDVYDEGGNAVYTVRGELALGHRLNILNARGEHLGVVQQKLLRLLPTFELYAGNRLMGRIRKEFTIIRPRFTIDCNGWSIDGNWLEWDYTIRDANGGEVAVVSKELFQFTDTYVIDVRHPDDALAALMVVLAIDAEKCSRD